MKAPSHPLVTLLLAGAPALLPVRAEGQSLLSSSGLGLPMNAVDARSRALGGPGMALFGSAILPTDPASAADLVAPELTFSLQHSWVDLQGPAEPDAAGPRFPVLGVAYPVQDLGVFTLTFSGVFDQRWNVESQGQVEFQDEVVGVTDRFVSDGGVSAVRFGYARRVTPTVALGVTAGRYAGDLRRTFVRTFDSLLAGSTIPRFVRGGLWSYRGTTVTAGAQADVGSFLRVSGSLNWSGELEAEPSPDTEGPAETFSVPVEYRVGASAALTPALSFTAGMQYADWAGTGDADLGGRAVLGLGGGIEIDGFTLLGRPMPVRLGYRSTELPFAFDGEEPTESVWSAGFGLGLAQGEVSRAGVDVSVETGDRSAGSLSESFWRATVSVRVAGN